MHWSLSFDFVQGDWDGLTLKTNNYFVSMQRPFSLNSVQGDWDGYTLKVNADFASRPLPLNSIYDAPLLFVAPSDKLNTMKTEFLNQVGKD